MHSFTPEYLLRLSITPDILGLVGKIREYKGKQELYQQRQPQVLRDLQKSALIDSVESSNRLENIEIDRKTLRDLVEKRTKPSKRPQHELAGYCTVLETIHNNHAGMNFTPSLVRQLHRDLMSYTPMNGGVYKNTTNEIVEKNAQGAIIRERFRTVAPHLTETAMADLHTGYQRALQLISEPLILIPNYVHDFLCIHPFADGNGRIVRLITVLLLYQNGFDIAKYISLERTIEASKETYYSSLHLSDTGWWDGKHNHTYFTSYLLGVILAAYRELDNNISNLENHKGYKTELVQRAIRSLPTEFTIAELEHHCPSVSRDTLRNVMRTLRDQGKIINLAKGRGAKWKRMW